MRVTELAGCIIRNHQNEILLLHRNTPKLHQWELPGGKLEVGETPAAAAIREIDEELGVAVRIIDRIGTADFSMDGIAFRYYWFTAELLAMSSHPIIKESELFDVLAYWDVALLKQRQDLSSNMQNLIGSGLL